MSQFNNNAPVQGQGQGFAAYQPGMPISNVGSTSAMDARFDAANSMVMDTLFGAKKPDVVPQQQQQQYQSQNNQTSQPNTQSQYEDPTMRAAANVLVDQEARRIANESLPDFFRRTPNSQPVASQQIVNSQQPAQGNSQFGVPSNQNNNQTSFQDASGNDWWSKALGLKTPDPAVQSNVNNQQQQFSNEQTTNVNRPIVNDDLMQYGQNVSEYNTRMYREALKAGVDVEQFKQAMTSMSPEKAASMVINELRALASNNNGGMPTQNNPMNVQGNGYTPVNPNSLQGYNGQSVNNNNSGMYNQQTGLPINNIPNNQVPIQLANLPGANNVSATGVNTGHRFSSAWGSES